MLPRRFPLAVFLIPLLSGCGSAPSGSYRVVIDPSTPHEVQVVADWVASVRDSLVLAGFESVDVLHVSDLHATAPSGTELPVLPSTGTLTAEGRTLSVPRFVVRGPLPSRVHVRYRVDPDVREGDAHVGFSSVRYGYLGRGFAELTGRNLFLLPQGAPVRDVEVRFALPRGWRAVTPWRSAGAAFRTAIGGRFADEHLIASTLAFGPFTERSVSIGGTRYRFAYEPGSPGATAAIGSLERATVAVHSLFGRNLGPEYVTAVLPSTPDGNEIHGEAWAAGQGETLVPMTPSRLRRYAQGLIDAYLKFSPYRDEIPRPEEYWVMDGISHLYAWRAVAAAGLVDEDEIERDLATSYAGAQHVQGSERDLEHVYDSKLDTGLAREVEAPFVLAYLDRSLRESTRGRATLDRAVRRMFHTRPAGSIWASIEGTRPGAWDAFRDRYVRGRETIPAGRLFGLAPAQPTPSPPAGKPVGDLTVIFTGDTTGFR
jgi:hypothetical protein